ncbi:hypothetical protein C8R44DRAFT_977288 [Mycena epipterygia]|nr:hypothetical protein C8R44DRAFT_977288 [Mycena epipterygia]
MSSDLLRHRLPPLRIDVGKSSTHAGFKPISAAQVVAAQRLNPPTHWSVEPRLHSELIGAISNDFDELLPESPQIVTDLRKAMQMLLAEWELDFGDNAFVSHGNRETATRASSRIFSRFGAVAVSVILGRNHLVHIPEEPSPSAQDIIIDNVASSNRMNPASSFIVGVEDKCSVDMPQAVEELTRRGMACGVVEVEVAAPAHQPNWWVIANKGALYAAAYDVDWVIFSGMNVFCVGYRIGHHVLWSSPIFNRHDPGDEVTPHSNAALARIFSDPLPVHPQTELPLLFLAVILKAMMAGKCHNPTLEAQFPTLYQLEFDIPSGKSNFEQYTSTGRDHPRPPSSEEPNSNCGDHGEKSKDFIGENHHPPTYSTRLSAGQYEVVGEWRGELADPKAGYSVQIQQHLLGEGTHCTIYDGTLWKAGKAVCALAIKVSDQIDNLLREFDKYEALSGSMGSSLPRCYGVCVSSGSAFLITSFSHGSPENHL